MDTFMQYFKVFLVGGAFCAVGQILVDKTKLTPARILTAFVVAGVVLGAFGAYGWLVDFAGAGATVPITGFGYALSEGVRRAVVERGFLGVFTGGFTAASGGTAAAIVFAVAAAMVSRSKIKS